jgi:hypothetical protein
MPEPTGDNKGADHPEADYSIDKAQSFETNMTTVTSKDKVLFFMLPVIICFFISFRWFGMRVTHAGVRELRTRDYHFQSIECGHLWGRWIWIVIYVYFLLWVGCSPRSWCGRVVAIAVNQEFVLMHGIEVGSKTTGARWMQFISSAYSIMAVEVYVPTMVLMLWFMGFYADLPNVYSVRSSWGVYCCAAFQRGRSIRINALNILVGGTDTNMSGMLNSLSAAGGAAADAVPLMVFAWKRFKFVGLCVLCVDDSPWKYRCLFPCNFVNMLLMNAVLAISMITASSVAQTLVFIISDWFQFGTRVVLLNRFGIKTCPGLITFLIKKQLENCPSPLPNAVLATGEKTAMRCIQAFMAIMEGDTLTINFAYLSLIAIHWGIVDTDPIFEHAMPIGVWVVFVFGFLDCIQDVIAAKSANKFSNFSYMYDRQEGWHAKRLYMFLFGYYFAWQALVYEGGCSFVKNMVVAENGAQIEWPVTSWLKDECSMNHL